MKSLEDQGIDLTEIEGEFVMLPEEKFYEAAVYCYDISFYRDEYYASCYYFNFTDGEWGTMNIDGQWFSYNADKMEFMSDNKYAIDYRKYMIEMILENESEGSMPLR